jgi:DNA-binding CsgD family transcriptional regulator
VFPAIQLLIRTGSQIADIAPSTLTSLFLFTRAEASLALKLVNGQRLYDAAASLGISKFTARCQLSAMFSKTACHRQSELIKLILNTLNGVWRTS